MSVGFVCITRPAAIAITAILGLLVACGGDDSASVDSVAPTTASTTTTTASTTSTAPSTTTTTTTEPVLVGSPAFDSSSSVSTVGLGALTFGMSVAEAERTLGADFVEIVEGATGECYEIRPAGGPAGVMFTVTGGTIERVDISTEEITTRSGAGVGMSETDLFDLFGERLTSEARTGGGNTITFTPVDPGDAEFRVIFESDGTVITSFRSGRVPQVMPGQACS